MSKSLGDILLEKGFIDQQGLDRALAYQLRKFLGDDFRGDWASNLLIDVARKKYNKRDEYYLGRILTELKLLPEIKVQEALEIQKAMPKDAARGRFGQLQRIIGRINSSYNLIDLLNQILVQAAGLAEAECASLMIYDHRKDVLVILMPTGPSAEAVRDAEIPTNAGIAGWVFQNNQAVTCNDTAGDSRFYSAVDEQSGYASRQIICAPLTVKGKRLGALEVINSTRTPPSFTEADQLLLEMLSSGAAIAIENTRLALTLAHIQEEMPFSQERAVQAERMRVASLVLEAFQHELEGSFVPIKGYADKILEVSADARVEKYHSYIKREMDRLLTHAHDILCFMREDCPIARRPVDVGELVRDFEAESWVECRLFGVSLHTVVAGRFTITGDREQLSKCLRSLLRNSREAMPEGGDFSVEVRRRDVSSLEMVVKDNGPGLTCEPIAKVFEPFFASGKPHAAGLGLSITKRIIEAHGGSISAANADKGAVFTIVLPTA